MNITARIELLQVELDELKRQQKQHIDHSYDTMLCWLKSGLRVRRRAWAGNQYMKVTPKGVVKFYPKNNIVTLDCLTCYKWANVCDWEVYVK